MPYSMNLYAKQHTANNNKRNISSSIRIPAAIYSLRRLSICVSFEYELKREYEWECEWHPCRWMIYGSSFSLLRYLFAGIAYSAYIRHPYRFSHTDKSIKIDYRQFGNCAVLCFTPLQIKYIQYSYIESVCWVVCVCVWVRYLFYRRDNVI